MDKRTFAQAESEDQRRFILEMLEQDADYSHNENILGRALESVGHTVSSDKLLTELHWLQEQGLVDLNEVMSLTIAKLTKRGLDVAKGATQVPGIARKSL